jgi:hypothetical protein
MLINFALLAICLGGFLAVLAVLELCFTFFEGIGRE